MAATGQPPRHLARWALHGAAAAVVVGGVVLQVARPLAPDLGPPPLPDGAFDAAYLGRAAAYRAPLYVGAVVAILLRVAVTAWLALTPPGRRLVVRITDRVGAERPARAAAVVITGAVIAADLVILPLSFWAGYIHDGRYGLRTQGLGGWFYDWFVLHVPVWIGIAVLALVGYWLAGRLPRLWPPVAGLAAAVAAAVVTFGSPLVLEPLLYDFEALGAGPVRDEVVAVLDAAGEQVDDILVADASRRSTRVNAYISGFSGSERVVLYDTLVRGRPVDEVGVILAHELAHKQNADVLRSVFLAGAGVVVTAYAVQLVVRRRTRAGAQQRQMDPRNAAVVLLTVLVLNIISTPLQSGISRRAEAAADLGSLQFTDAPETFVSMQRALTEANLGEPLPPAVVTWWWGSHPPAMARIGMARWWRQR